MKYLKCIPSVLFIAAYCMLIYSWYNLYYAKPDDLTIVLEVMEKSRKFLLGAMALFAFAVRSHYAIKDYKNKKCI